MNTQTALLTLLLVGFYGTSWGLGFEAGKQYKRRHKKKTTTKPRYTWKRRKLLICKEIEAMKKETDCSKDLATTSYNNALDDVVRIIIGM